MLAELARLRDTAWARLPAAVRDYVEMTAAGPPVAAWTAGPADTRPDGDANGRADGRANGTAGVADEAAERAWAGYALRPHVLRDVSRATARTTVLGRAVEAPVLVAPIGYLTRAHEHGDVAVAQAAARAGTVTVVSTRATSRFEEIAATGADWWLQVYLMRDRGLTGALVDRAVALGARALVLTADTPVLGDQSRYAGALDSRAAHLTNLDLPSGRPVGEGTVQDPAAVPADVGWLVERSGLPVLVKGVLRADDARSVLDAGAAGVIVSNHGGRQLRRVLSTARALPAVAEAVGDRGETYVDGGIRDGSAVLTALALGARAVLLGRPVVWGLAADGVDGVARALRAVAADFAYSLAVAGVDQVSAITRDLVDGAAP